MIDNPISFVKNTRQTYSKQFETIVTEVQVQFADENPAWIHWILYLPFRLLVMEKKPVANVASLILFFVSTLGIIYAGYIHGKMSISSVYHSLTNFT